MTNYKEMLTLPDWEEALKKSNDKPVLIFKHSTTCPVSAAAYKEFTSTKTDLDSYLVKVIESRPVSNEIERQVGIQHKSPQILLLAKEEAVWHASHWDITEDSIGQAIPE